MEIVQQLRGLFLEALPTIFLLLLLFLFLKKHFFGPLERVMADRAARTEGARKAAEDAVAAAQAKEAAYQDALRKARSQVYADHDEARRKVLGERMERIRKARSAAQEQMRAAKDRIAGEAAAARTALEKDSDSLAREIARVVLEPRPPSAASPGGTR